MLISASEVSGDASGVAVAAAVDETQAPHKITLQQANRRREDASLWHRENDANVIELPCY
jgi:hypothetical protein